MKQIFTIFIVLGFSILIINTSQAQEAEINVKTIHLFDLPEDVSEPQMNSAIKELNEAIKTSGFSNAGYSLYKVQSDTINEFRYLVESKWANQEIYDSIHAHQVYIDAHDKHMEMFNKVFEGQIYRRVSKISSSD